MAVENHFLEAHGTRSWEHWDDVVAFAPGQGDLEVTDFINNMLPKCKQWVVKRKKSPKTNPYDDEVLRPYYVDLKSFVAYLDTIQITPAIKTHKGLNLCNLIITDKNHNNEIMPNFIVERFRSIWQRWGEKIQDFLDENSNDNDNEYNGETGSGETGSRLSHSQRPNHSKELPKISYPSRNHPFYGVDGIMYGVLAGKPSASAKFRYVLDPRLTQRNASVVGHNGILPGDWFPKQLVALFKGAHGSSQGGIAGSRGHGAFSIIVGSAQYESMDEDCGNVIYYSGAQKSGARLPGDQADSTSTKLLLESYSKGNLIRVLRKKSDKSQHAPAEGLRYDGLYRITKWVERSEITTGRYRVLLFTLVRDAGKISLDDTKARAPSAAEQRKIMEAVERGY